MDVEGRPPPAALPAPAAREQRSRLKVFVGAAPGVGKTSAMLQAACEQQQQGADIVIGAVATHGRPETQALLEGLEVIRGETLEELDLDAILARRPTLVVVDELAHTNAPGSRHLKRFQDVEELLDAGIDVYTTVNIQHLESLNDVVAQITGVRVRETIPDRVLDRADEIQLIDLSPEALLVRLRTGKVYVPEQAERVIRTYFPTAVHDLARRETAQHGDDQMQARIQTRSDGRGRPVGQPSVGAASGGPLAERLGDEAVGRKAGATASARAYALAAGLVAAAGFAAAGIMGVLPLRDPGMLFLAAVLLSAVVGGLKPSILASLLSVLTYDFFFTEPFHSLRMTDPQDYLSLGAFLIVAVLTSHLTARVREQAASARRREARAAALYAFSRAITGAATLDDLSHAIATHVAHALGAAAAVLLPDAGRLSVRSAYPADTAPSAPEIATATWAWQHGQPAGYGTEGLLGGGWLHVPLSTVRGVVGVLAIHVGHLGSEFAREQRQLLEALAGQAALAIERSRVDVVEAIIESIEDGLVVLDHEGVIVHVNDVACAILGCERTDALGHRFDALGTNHPHYVRLRTAVHDFLAQPERDRDGVEVGLFHRGREHRYVLRPTPFLDRSGVPAGHILVLQDVTHLRDHEARREQLMATLSHELRTPLASQRMAVELLERALKPLDGRRGDLVAAVKRDVGRLEDVAQRLLEVSRGRAMTIALERLTVDLGAVLARVGELFALQAAERGIAFETTAPRGGLTITGDATKLTWALSNLVTNALRYTPRGGCVTVEAVADDGTVRIAVSDSGPGIPSEQRERIFERFVQGHEGPAGAAGLGLAIVRDIVQAHGGRIRLDSEVGRGSRFTLDLPRG
jgi:two-component system, OmpR family, sensor histidine kinase KdpD